MKVNIGGDRIGSGAKMQVNLHNYGRSTHNLSKKVQTSMSPGVLYPVYTNIGLNGDKFDIDIESLVRTLPTQGPLFGSFKFQVDCFVAPIRLYHGVLHNNPVNIGLKMNQVKLPKFYLSTKRNKKINNSNIWKYLGMSGTGRNNEINTDTSLRLVNGVPLLAYYEIFKNYYANKQEDNAYVISDNQTSEISSTITKTGICPNSNWGLEYNDNICTLMEIDTEYTIHAGDLIYIEGNNLLNGDQLLVKIENNNAVNVTHTFTLIKNQSNSTKLVLECNLEEMIITRPQVVTQTITKEGINLQAFPLENIDKMREALLNIKLGEEFIVDDYETNNLPIYPYSLNSATYLVYQGKITTHDPLIGLCVKTYQSNIFNNWIKTETIDGENGIRAITKVDTTNGLELDALNLAQKVYNMLNRIAVSGGTYEDWQEAVYSYKTVRKAETPMYVGGMSSEVMFEEVLATAATETQQSGDVPIGDMGGRGKQLGEKGGHVKFEIEEPSIIMIIASLTPRETNSQGNKWFLTELDTLDDLHKPALDGIGYQDLLVEQMVWTGTTIDSVGTPTEKLSAGKTIAWINYMTDYNECYGDFADNDGRSYMVLNRNYDIVENADGTLASPSDITTYIQPDKFNYVFAYKDITAQNFWVELQFNIQARRLMSAKQIPNL